MPLPRREHPQRLLGRPLPQTSDRTSRVTADAVQTTRTPARKASRVDPVADRAADEHADHDTGRQEQRDLPRRPAVIEPDNPSPARLSRTPTKKNTDSVDRITAGGSRWKSSAIAGPPMEVAVPVTPAPKPAPTRVRGRDRDPGRTDGDRHRDQGHQGQGDPDLLLGELDHQPRSDDRAGDPAGKRPGQRPPVDVGALPGQHQPGDAQRQAEREDRHQRRRHDPDHRRRDQAHAEADDGLHERAEHGGQAQHHQDLPGEVGQGQPRIGPPGRS